MSKQKPLGQIAYESYLSNLAYAPYSQNPWANVSLSTQAMYESQAQAIARAVKRRLRTKGKPKS